jgi:hypothetical protein
MAKWKLKLEVTKQYELEVEADTYEQAHVIADKTAIDKWRETSEQVWLIESPTLEASV